MKPEIKKLWLRALRRRKNPYQQGRGFLRSDGGFCCLGVLCDLHQLETGEGEWDSLGDDGVYGYALSGSDYSKMLLPKSVMEWAGLREDDPVIGRTTCGIEVALSQLNDGHNEDYGSRYVGPKTFREIANVIDKKL